MVEKDTFTYTKYAPMLIWCHWGGTHTWEDYLKFMSRNFMFRGSFKLSVWNKWDRSHEPANSAKHGGGIITWLMQKFSSIKDWEFHQDHGWWSSETSSSKTSKNHPELQTGINNNCDKTYQRQCVDTSVLHFILKKLSLILCNYTLSLNSEILLSVKPRLISVIF